jgi:hypothetical protein
MQQNAKACPDLEEPSTPVLCVGSILTAASPIAEERGMRHKAGEDRPMGHFNQNLRDGLTQRFDPYE